MKKMVSTITYTPELNISMLNNILREAEDPKVANLKLLKKSKFPNLKNSQFEAEDKGEEGSPKISLSPESNAAKEKKINMNLSRANYMLNVKLLKEVVS